MRLIISLHFILLACIVLCQANICTANTVEESSGQVWEVGSKRWDVGEEERFAAWVETTITEDFFLRYDIPIDCANVPYAIRWIYARSNHLPAAATTEDGHLIGQWSTNWGSLPTNTLWYRDRRFRAALLHMLTVTSTRTLPADTYPIRISPDAVQAGTVFIGEGHAGIVGRIVQDGSMYSPIQTWEATLPRKVTKLRQGSYFATWPDLDAGSGLVKFRWPIFSDGRWRYLAAQDQPFYSLEEYDPKLWNTDKFFDEEVAKKIDPKQYDPADRVRLITNSIYDYLKVRVALVQAGYRHCRQGNCPEGSYLWEVYSTPGRDDMIVFEIEHLLELIKADNLDKEAIKKTMEGMLIPIGDGKTVSLNYIVENDRWLSHNPGDSIEARWGLYKCDMIRSRIQDSLKTIGFVEQRYASTDPGYAEYIRNLRLANISSLQEEERRAGCTTTNTNINTDTDTDIHHVSPFQNKPLWPTLEIRREY
jgi:hypothetical protein